MFFSKLPLRTSVSLFLRTRRRPPLQDWKRKYTVSAAESAKNVVNIVEVGPRDGLQNEKSRIPVEIKVELINSLVRAGVMNVEAGSFVRPEWVPQVCILHIFSPKRILNFKLRSFYLLDGWYSRGT